MRDLIEVRTPHGADEQDIKRFMRLVRTHRERPLTYHLTRSQRRRLKDAKALYLRTREK